MERSSKRGKIPQQDWPSIIARYEAGETLASIARTYDCSPPAISYIVSRSRARSAAAQTTAESALAPAEPQLVKSHEAEMPIGAVLQGEGAVGQVQPGDVSPAVPPPVERLNSVPRRDEPRLFPDEVARASGLRKDHPQSEGKEPPERHGQGQHNTNPAGSGDSSRSFGPAGAPPQSGEPRRTLHLSLSQGGNAPGGS